jgi:hypothetical protein
MFETGPYRHKMVSRDISSSFIKSSVENALLQRKMGGENKVVLMTLVNSVSRDGSDAVPLEPSLLSHPPPYSDLTLENNR